MTYEELLQVIKEARTQKLESLDLSFKNITELPAEIGDLESLSVLDLSGNQLRDLPTAIINLPNLHKLYLSNNQLRELPTEICNLKNLHELDLSDNQLRELPAEIGNLLNLHELYLSDNQLRELPAEICNLANLSSLNLDGNELRELPAKIGNLANLSLLNLNGNELRELPAEIGNLTNLSTLDLDGNELRELPAEIGNLKTLSELYLSGNQLTDLPTEICNLMSLSELHLGENQLTDLLTAIGNLTNLSELNLGGNELRELPAEIGNLKNLSTLSLDTNKLIDLPPEIGQIISLKTLDVQNNCITSLPLEIQLLRNLKKIDLRGNLLQIPPEILGDWPELGKPQNIFNYYFQLHSGTDKPLNEAKVLIVGQGNVGKTSLVKRLTKNIFDPDERKTEGINIQNWYITVNEQTIRLNVWDFGGQEIMHATHQFFLTKRSLYILAIDTRLGEKENRIEYWLKMIQSYGGNAPVIVVGNKIDQHPIDLDQRGLLQKYPNIKHIAAVSCEQGEGITELKAAITQEIGQLDNLQDSLPQEWFEIKTRLEQMQDDYIPYSDYERLCLELQVTDPSKQNTLIELLHRLGIVLSFRSEPRLAEMGVLNPEWVTNGVYKILNDRQLILDDKGILDCTQLQRILEPIRYPSLKQRFLVDLMQKFELCFPLEDGTNKRVLIPDLLPKEEPATGDWDNALTFQYHYPVLPSSVISRFIVRMHHLADKRTWWRNGIVLKLSNNRALVKADQEDKRLYIWVSGPIATRRELLAAIRSQLDAIHQSITGLDPKAKVPIPGHPNAPAVDYVHLLDLEQMGELIFIPEGLKERINVQDLLNGIDLAEHTRHRSVRERNKALNLIGTDPFELSEPVKLTEDLPEHHLYSGKEGNIVKTLSVDCYEVKFRDDKSQTYINLSLHSDQLAKSSPEKEIFVSYAWGGESGEFVDRLEEVFQSKNIKIVRDKRDVQYKGLIREFMQRIGRGKCVISVISKKYLESPNCMFELVEVAANGKFHQRIFPVILSDAKIYDPLQKLRYIKYWEDKKRKLDEAMKEVGSENLQGIREEIDHYTNIRNTIAELTSILSNMNNLTSDIHSKSEFAELVEAIDDQLNQ
jgi:internalin A